MIYTVRVDGECFELYEVEADTPEEAMENWAEGVFLYSETMGVSPVSAVADA